MLSGLGLYEEEHEAFRRTVRAIVDRELPPPREDLGVGGASPASSSSASASWASWG